MYKLFKIMEVAEKSTNMETLLKLHLGQILPVPVMAGNKRDENPPLLPTPRQAALESARQEMQAIQEIVRPEEKNTCCMAPGNKQKSVKYSRITPPSTPCSGHTKKNKKKPDTAATKNEVRLSILTAQQKR